MPKVTYDKKKGTKTVLDKRGKTVYNPKERTTTTYNKKGKTIVDNNPKSKNYGTTVVNKKGVQQKLKPTESSDAATVIKNKKGVSIQFNKKGEPGYTKIVYDKFGKRRYGNESINFLNKKGEYTIDRKPEETKTENKMANKKPNVNKFNYKGKNYEYRQIGKDQGRFYLNGKLVPTRFDNRIEEEHVRLNPGLYNINDSKKETENKMANSKDKTNKKSSSNSGIKPVTGKIQPVTGKIEPVNYKSSGSKSSQKSSSNKNASSSKTKQAPKKEKGFIDKANDFVDWAFRDAANKKVGEVNKSVQSKLDSTRKKVGDVNKKVQKDLDPYRKKAADLNKTVQKKLDPVREAVYGKDKTPNKSNTGTKKVTPPISKAPVKKESQPKKESFNLEEAVKKTMSGGYGSGTARKEALGANYSKVQAEINKRTAANKPKKTESKTVAKPESIRMEIRKPEMIKYQGSKELQGVTPSKPAVDVDKSIDAAMDAIGKSKIMRKGGNVKSNKLNKMKTYKTGGMVNPNAKMQAGKKATGKSGGTSIAISKGAVKSAKPKGRSGGTNKPAARPKKG